MFLKVPIYYIIIISISSIILISCSSTSVQKRYNKAEVKEETVDNSIRFTSKSDDPVSKGSEKIVEFDEEPVEEIPVDVNRFVSENEITKGSSSQLTNREKVLYEIVKYINTPYQYGGSNEKGIDCSAFTQNVFSNSIKFTLPRTASEQFNTGQDISSESSLIFGDLVFFNTTKNSYPGHVGIYMDNGLFAHSSSSRGVTISSIENSYYQKRFVGGRRTVKISD